MKNTFLFFFPILMLFSVIKAQTFEKIDYQEYVNAPYFIESNGYIATNNILMWVGNTGMGSHNPSNDDSGFYWPGGINASKTAIFVDGPLFGFIRDDSVRVYGSTYRYGFTPGILDSEGNVISDSGDYKIFKTRLNWQSIPDPALRAEYQYDHENWPVEQGAPFIDNDGDGNYNPEIDEPARKGDEMLWWSNHTADSATTKFLYGSAGDKLEVKTCVWGEQTIFPDVVYKQYKFINKSDKDLTDFYFGYWSDPDVGFAQDDFVGCDPALELAYSYNGDSNDNDVYFSNPPAVGYVLLDGPIIPATLEDTARYDGELRSGYKNVPMTAFAFYINGDATYQDPDLGVYEGSVQMYNYLKGYNWQGSPYIDPTTNEETKLPLGGDRVNHTGWYEGPGWIGGPPPGDRRMLMSAGPFSLAAGDTNCVTIAILIQSGQDFVNSISVFKDLAGEVRSAWGLSPVTSLNYVNEVPDAFHLSQNYPNPFNPVTTIEFSIPEQSNVKLEVFNILGEKVTELVNTQMKAGTHKVNFDASALSSGIYLYSLKAGKTNITKKMIVLK